jgi:peptidoglycan hydrolase CwlO-like protein
VSTKVDHLSLTIDKECCTRQEMNNKVDELDNFLTDTYITKTAHALQIDKLKTEIDKSNSNIDGTKDTLER